MLNAECQTGVRRSYEYADWEAYEASTLHYDCRKRHLYGVSKDASTSHMENIPTLGLGRHYVGVSRNGECPMLILNDKCSMLMVNCSKPPDSECQMRMLIMGS